MINKNWILILSGALLLSCKPTPRTAIDSAHKEEATAPQQVDTQTQQPQGTDSPSSPEPEVQQPVGLLEVSVTKQAYNRLRPWEKQNITNGNYMGVYLGNGRVLTLGQAAKSATYVELSLPDHSRTAPARVVKYDDELNLALLTVEHAEDASIFNDMPELSVGEPLALGDKAEICALVREQDPVRITAEAISANDEDEDSLPKMEMRAGSPLPQGNSAGLPILSNGKLVALTERYARVDQSLTCINAEFISRFLNESAIAGESVPVLGLVFTGLDDPVFNKYLKLDAQQGGVYISKVLPGSAAANAGIREGDVLLSIDGLALDKLGRAQHPLYGLLDARHIIRSLKPIGEQLSLTISRDGQAMEITLTLNRDALEKSLFKLEKPGTPPRYIMWGGLLFQPLTETYMNTLQSSANSLPLPFLKVKDRAAELQAEGAHELVALTLVVPTPATLGYDALGFCVVEQVNGEKITSFAQFAELLDAPTEDGVIELTLNRSPYHIYLDRQTVEASNDTIRRRAIPRLRQMGPEPTEQPQ